MSVVTVIGEAGAQGKSVINVTSKIIPHQIRIAGARGRDSNLLCAPIQINPDSAFWKKQQAAHASMKVEN